jgi:signal transduction histidine kinase
VALTIVLGVLLTLAAFSMVRQASLERLTAHFDRASASLGVSARQSIANHLDVLYSLRDDFVTHGTLSRAQFATFARAQLERHPGIRALEWVPVVTDAQRPAFEAAARRDGLSGFRLTDRGPQGTLVPTPKRDVYYPVFYVEPLEGNEPALGYTPVLPARDAAIAIARDTGEPSASQAFPIVQSSKGRVGVAVFVPVYGDEALPPTLALRRKKLTGLVEGVVLPGDILRPLIDSARSLGVVVSLIDESAPPGERALISAPRTDVSSRFHHTMPLAMGGRRWLMSCTLVDDRPLAGAQGQEWGVLLAGLGATGLLAGYLSMVLERRSRAEQLVEERTRALSQARELDRMKNNFSSAVSHDLRTPLTSILGYAEFLEDGIGGELSAEQQTYVVQIMRGARRLEHLVDDLLDFARIDAGTFQLKRQPVDLAIALQEVTDSLRPQLDEAGLTVALDLPDAPLVASLDAPRIERVLFNLLHNAIKFTEPGGSIRLRARREGDAVRCEVSDTGIGIAPEQIPKLFKRFSQLEDGSVKGGTGLGLSIAKAIVEAHGGDIGVESERGRGATFWFTLPAEPGAPAAG